MDFKKIFDKIKKPITIIGFLFMLIGGFIYSYQQDINPIYKLLSIIQNAINATTFHPDLKIKDLAGVLKGNLIFEFFGIGYGLALIVTPIGAAAILADFIKDLIRLQTIILRKSYEQIIVIFGFNNSVIKWINEDKNKNKLFVIFTDEDIKVSLTNKKNVKHFVVDYRDMGAIKSYFDKVKSFEANDRVIIYDNDTNNINIMNALVNFKDKYNFKVIYCVAKEPSMKKQYAKIAQKYKDKYDIKVLSDADLSVRNLLEQVPLTKYYEYVNDDILTENGNLNNNEMHIHHLVLGLGNMSQSYILQTINQSVLSDKNIIIYDIYDKDIEKCKYELLENFSRTYIGKEIKNENSCEYEITNKRADGQLILRFRKLDVCIKEFDNAMDKDKMYKDRYLPFTHIFIGIPQIDASYKIQDKIERYLLKRTRDEEIKRLPYIYSRIKVNNNDIEHINISNELFNIADKSKETWQRQINIENVLICEKDITLENFLANKVDELAKEFNYYYYVLKMEPSYNISDDLNKLKKEHEKNVIYNENVIKQKKWDEADFYDKESSILQAVHQDTKKWLLEKCYKNATDNNLTGAAIAKRELSKIDGFRCTKYNECKVTLWEYDDEEELLVALENNKVIAEMLKLEHRRWCYAVATLGWGESKKENVPKDKLLRKNICLCDWETLKSRSKEKCKGDIQPLLVLNEEA